MQFLPTTKLGKWSALGIAVFAFLFLLGTLIAIFSGWDRGTVFDKPAIFTPVVLALISLIFAFVVGLLSIVKDKERSILVILATLAGFLVLLFLIGGSAFSH